MELNSITKLDQATRMLAEVKTIDDAKNLINLAEAARVYAKQIELGLEAQNHAAEIKLHAQRKAGEILSSMEKAKGGQPYQATPFKVEAVENKPPTYQELGINYKDAHQWQTFATNTSPEEFQEIIDEKKDNGQELSTADVYRQLRRKQQQQANVEKHSNPMPEGKYKVIYADPPWQYDNSGFDEAAESQYPTMPVEEICNLPVSDLADETTVIFLWATNPLLKDALQVLDAWGFEYKTNLAWIKDRGRGKGWYLKSKHELLLIGVRGKTPHPLVRPDSAQAADRGLVHSKKPELFYEIIEAMYSGSKIELFARNTRPSWDCWGNEV